MEKHNIRYVLGISLIGALGGFLFGYDWVVIGGAKPFYEQYFYISEIPRMQGWVGHFILGGHDEPQQPYRTNGPDFLLSHLPFRLRSPCTVRSRTRWRVRAP